MDYIGRAIPPEGETITLYNRYINFVSDIVNTSATLEEFQDALKEEALGINWPFKLLRELYTSSQGNMTVKEYVSYRDNLAFTISRIMGGVPPIDPFAEKSHLLFQADPRIFDAILDRGLDRQKFVRAEKKDIVQWLNRYESVKTGSFPTAPAPGYLHSLGTNSIPTGIDTVLRMYSPCYGYLSGSYHDTGRDLPQDKTPRITRFTANGSYPELSSYEFGYENPSKTIRPLSLYSGGGNLTFDLGPQEYLRILKTWHYGDYVQRICFVTSKGVEYTLGGKDSWDQVIEAPSGWSIIGLHGHYDSVGNPTLYRIKSLGCIFGRVPIVS